MPYADPVKAAESGRVRCRRYYARHRDEQQARALTAYYSNPARSHANSAQWKAEHPEDTAATKRKSWLKSAYDLTPEGFAALVDAQNGACAGCTKAFEATPHVDHCHATGRVRGLLCMPCNTTLGHANDDPETLRRLAAYLEE